MLAYRMNAASTNTIGSTAPNAKAKMLNQSVLLASLLRVRYAHWAMGPYRTARAIHAPRISWYPPLKLAATAALKRIKEAPRTTASDVSRMMFFP